MNRRTPKTLKASLKALRSSVPFNVTLTAAVRGLTRAFGRESEFAIAHLPRVGEVRARLPNGQLMRLWSRGDDWVANQVYWRGWSGFEPEMSPIFLRLAAQSGVTVDVGAHVGFYTVVAALANPRGRVFAFEPLPSVFERLRRNVALNGLTNVSTVPAAASNHAGQAHFFYSCGEGIPSSSSLSEDFMTLGQGSFNTTAVAVVRLDEYLRNEHVGRIDLVKVDTETTEADVLEGMRETIARDRPAIFCEVLRGADLGRLHELLEPLDYRYLLLTGTELSERPKIVPDGKWTNYLLISRSEQLAVVALE